MLKFIRLVALAGVAGGLVVAPSTASAGPKEKPVKKATKPAKDVPEINGTHAGAAIALVIGGAAVVLGRRRRSIA